MQRECIGARQKEFDTSGKSLAAPSSQKSSRARAEKSAAGFFIGISESDDGRTSRRRILPMHPAGRRKRAVVRTFQEFVLAGTRERAGARRGVSHRRTRSLFVEGYTIGGFNDSIMTMVPNLQSK